MFETVTESSQKLIEKYAWDSKESNATLSFINDFDLKIEFGEKVKLSFRAKNDKNAIDALTIYWKIRARNWRNYWSDGIKRTPTIIESIRKSREKFARKKSAKWNTKTNKNDDNDSCSK